MSLYRGNQILECGGVPSNGVYFESGEPTSASVQTMEWQYLGESSGANLTLPEDWKELLIYQYTISTPSQLVEYHILRKYIDLKGTRVLIHGGYYGSTNGAFSQIEVTKTTTRPTSYRVDGTTCTSAIDVYYR